MIIPFHAFGPIHLAVLAMVPALAAVLGAAHRKLPVRAAATIRWTLAGLLCLVSLALLARTLLIGLRIFPDHLPLELCDASVWLMIAVLLTRKPALFDVAYYWAVAGAGMALFTPDFTQNTLFMWVQYFMSHGLIVASALYLVWSAQLRPRAGSVLRSLLGVNLFAVVAGACDYFYGTDYMFLRHRPEGATLLDAFGPWPWYILACEFVGLGLFLLLYLPFRAGRKTSPLDEPAEPNLEISAL
jgi:hypothetical integral membrane protein (TIGR02206 family)